MFRILPLARRHSVHAARSRGNVEQPSDDLAESLGHGDHERRARALRSRATTGTNYLSLAEVQIF